jgi:hypothetical protein
MAATIRKLPFRHADQNTTTPILIGHDPDHATAPRRPLTSGFSDPLTPGTEE